MLSRDDVLMLDLNAALLAMLLAGLAARGRLASCVSFSGYITACLAGNRVVALWPDTFFTEEFYIVKEAVYSLLKAALAIEIAWATFVRFPRARVVAAALLSVVALLGAAGATAAREGGSWYAIALTIYLPRVQAALVWLYAAIATSVAWYRIPMEDLHKAVLLGLLLYLGAYGLGLTAIRELGLGAYPFYAALNPVAYAASVGVWTAAAWRPRVGAAPAALREALS